YLFLICLAGLTVASIVTYNMQPEAKSKVPILYWVTDPNPARELQIATFKKWLAKQQGAPKFEVRVDSANNDQSKAVIQGVSGVAGDLLDHCFGARLDYYTQIGLLLDVTEDAKKLGFDPSKTYPSIRPEITINGRQYTFPCNVYAKMLWVNKATFERFQQPLPPRHWNIETFEKMGKAFVTKANAEQKYRRYFYVNDMPSNLMYWSLGLDVFNETMTKCILDDPRYVRVLKLIWKWTNEDHLIPTSAERQSFATESGYGGATFQLFNSGNYAMVWCGRYALIQFRKFGKMKLDVVYPPNFEMEVTEIGTRATGVYAAGKYREMAKYFLAYLASRDYNMNIVHDADALPPNPAFTKTEEFLRPKDYPNEWGCHEQFAQAAINIGIPRTRSPFVLATTTFRLIWQGEDAFKSGVKTAEEVSRETARRINEAIELTLRENPRLRPYYQEQLALQKKIDEYRRQNRKVPLKWILNPFYRKWYKFKKLCVENE
ncbi:MAG: carbohydrate ABC transporter substrate-binding protein, partial [Lentisphaerae bacterium]